MERPGFIDPHVHLIDFEQMHYPWLSPPYSADAPTGETRAIARSYGLGSYLADLEGWNVRGLVHVDSGVHPDEILREVHHVQSVLDAAMEPREGKPPILGAAGIVACARLDTPDLGHILAAHKVAPLLRGVRQIVNAHPERKLAYPEPDRTRDAAWQDGLAIVARHGLTFDLQCYPEQMMTLAPLLRRHETMPVVIDHLGMPLFHLSGGREAWQRGMRALAACPNIHVKLSGFGFVRPDWRDQDIAPVLREVVDVFGVERCMIASDFPTDLLFAPARQTLDTILHFAEAFNQTEKRALFGAVAARFYRLDIAF